MEPVTYKLHFLQQDINYLNILASLHEIPQAGIVYAAIARAIVNGCEPYFGNTGEVKSFIMTKNTMDIAQERCNGNLDAYVSGAVLSMMKNQEEIRKWYMHQLPGSGSGKISKTK